MRPCLEKILHKKELAGRVTQGVGPEFKPQYCAKKIKIKKEESPTSSLSCSPVRSE
jgi:hypothetical protein